MKVASANWTAPQDAADNSAATPSNLRRFDFHPRALKLTPAGVQDFFLPAAEDSAHAFADEFSVRAIVLLRRRGIDQDRTAEAAWLVLIFMAFEAAVYFEMTQIAEGCAKKGLLAVCGDDDTKSVLASIAMGRVPPSIQVKALRSRHRRPSRLHDWGRWVASAFKADGYSRRPPPLLNRERDILCFSGLKGLVGIANLAGKRLVLSTFDQWFDNLPDDAALPKLSDVEFMTELVDLAESIFAAHQVPFRSHIRAGLLQTFTTLTRMADCLLAMIESKARLLPNEFMAVSMGSIYNRVLGHVVRKQGGIVTGHDHGTGSGTMYLPLQGQLDWDFCDAFLTYSEAQAEGIRLQTDPRYRVRSKPVEVRVSPKPLYEAISQPDRGGAHTGRPLRICYAPPHYALEYYYITPLPLDIATLDFQVRLLLHLKRAGHEVIYKPHPICHVGVVEELVRVTGVSVETRPFEEIAGGEVDVALVGHPRSTVIRSVLLSDLPLVILDPTGFGLLPRPNELLSRRAETVSLARSKENRIILDTERLDAAIQRSLTLRDHSFQHEYYPAA
jgi:hypothetical protein